MKKKIMMLLNVRCVDAMASAVPSEASAFKTLYLTYANLHNKDQLRKQ